MLVPELGVGLEVEAEDEAEMGGMSFQEHLIVSIRSHIRFTE